MIDLKFLPVHFSISLILGILFGFFFDYSLLLMFVGIIAAAAFFIFSFKAINAYRPPVLFVFFSGLLLMFYGMLIISRTKPEGDKTHYEHLYKSGSLMRIRLVEELKHNDYYFKYKAEVTGVDHINTSGIILIRITKNKKNSIIPLDEELYTFQPISALNNSMNPGAFDFREAMKRKGIYHQLTLDEGAFVRGKNHGDSIKAKALQYRDRILQSLRKRGFTKEEFSVLEALLLGRRQDLSNEMIVNYQNAGAMHLLAISGLHIGILLMILNTILKPMERFRHGKKIRFLLMIGFLWFFAFLSGLSASVIRAVFMFTVLSVGLYSGRKNKLSNYVFISLFFSLIINPGYLFDLGFQLSYAAVLSIIALSPLLRSFWKPNHRVLRYFWNLLIISLSAQLGVLPLSLYYFHQFSALFFLSSLCIIPFLGIILGMGYFMIVLDHFDQLPDFYIKTYGWVINMMNQIIEALAGLNHLIYRDIFFTLSLLWISYVIIIFFISWILKQSAKRTMALLVSTIFLLVILLVEKRFTLKSYDFVIFHRYKQSLVLKRMGNSAKIFGSLGEGGLKNSRLLRDYRLKHMALKFDEFTKMKHFFRIGDKRIMILDHKAINTDFGFEPDVLVLMNSPKINLERLLNEVHPEIIVADGSNYFSYKLFWQRTAEKHKIIFYDTAKMGAFSI